MSLRRRWTRIAGRVARLVYGRRFEDDIEEELRFHLDREAADHVARGMPPVAAHLIARRQLGSVAILKESLHDVWSIRWLEAGVRDLRHGFLAMMRHKRFTATVILITAVGIGANSAILSLVNTVLLRPLPYPDSDRIVSIRQFRSADRDLPVGVSPGQLEDWRREGRTLDSIGGYYADTFTDTLGDLPLRVPGAVVSPGFFSVLRTVPSLGRVFTEDEEKAGGPQVVVISERLRRRVSFDEPIGQQIRLGTVSYAVVGVAPADFALPSPITDVWVPSQAAPELMSIRYARWYTVVARLKDGMTAEQAVADLGAVQQRLGEQHPETDRGLTITVAPLKVQMLGNIRTNIWMLFGAGVLLLLVTSANVGCLLLAQAQGRTAEMMTRTALGATWMTVLRQLIAEAAGYAIVGGAVGLLLAALAIRVLRTQLVDMPRITELRLDPSVAAIIVAQVIVTTMLFALAPAIRLRLSRRHGLTQRARGLVRGGERATRALVIAQLGVATVLLIGAGLLVQSFVRLQQVPLGFAIDRVMALRVSSSYSDGSPAVIAQRQQRVMAALAEVPGVEEVAMASDTPGAVQAFAMEVSIAGRGFSGGASRPMAQSQVVTPGYFRALRIPMLAGETCPAAAGLAEPFGAVVNESFVDVYLDGTNPVGLTVTPVQSPAPPMQITGVVANVRERGFREPMEPIVYTCGALGFWPNSQYLVRMAGDPALMARALQEAVKRVEPSRAVYDVAPLEILLTDTLARPRFQAALISVFASVALLLAVVGLYGVLSYMVVLRMPEISLRLALGARPADVMRLVMRSAAINVVAGIGLGILVALGVVPVMSRVVFEVSAVDTLTYAIVAITIAVVAVGAALLPGWRAASVSPADVLKHA